MIEHIAELIKDRKSVRTFDGVALKQGDLDKLNDFIYEQKNPFGVEIDMRILDAKEYKLSSPVVVGEHAYIAAKVARGMDAEIAYGYSFEEVCLYAKSLEIGTVILAASLSRKEFEKAMDVQESEVLVAASPIGYPAAKMSMRESLMRKGMRSDDRLPFEHIFFKDTFQKGLSQEDAGVYADALEMMRLAPSATNKQPWRAIVEENKVHFYEAKSLGDNALGDVQKVDVGIGICHFDLTMKEKGYKGKFSHSDPGIDMPDKTFYIISYEMED